MLRTRLANFVPWLLVVFALSTIWGCSESSSPSAGGAKSASEVEDQTSAPPLVYSPAPAADAATEAIESGRAVAPTDTPPLEGVEGRPQDGQGPGQAGDRYATIEENPFLAVATNPLSTFAIDVDTASYAKTRAYLLQNRALPPADAVRIEELINYFDYTYPEPDDEHPFAVAIETAGCPWKNDHRLVRVGIQARRPSDERAPCNLVFLIDVSGSMESPNKLPLVKRGLEMLVRQLGENDRLAIVVYAGSAGLVLPSTSGAEQQQILSALGRLQAGGSTNGGEGIVQAYRVAEDNLISDGVNRVILCTDGDFNVGVTGTGELVKLAEDRAKRGIYLSVLGFGFGNHNDELLEQIADKANGNYGFIDSENEAHKLLVKQLAGTLVTVAQDVKIQVEFNPAQVAAYRLIGYENRRLADRDFNDDTKDAGEIGAGHTVTALYEVVPPEAAESVQADVDPLKYQETTAAKAAKSPESSDETSKELLTVKLRYQPPGGGKSTLMTRAVTDDGKKFGEATTDFQFASAVASFGMLLRGSRHKGDATFGSVMEIAAAARGDDPYGYRGEFLEMVRSAGQLSGQELGSVDVYLKRYGYDPRPATAASTTTHFVVTKRSDPSVFFTGLVIGAAFTVLAIGGLLFAWSRAATSSRREEIYPPNAKGKAIA